MSRKIEYERTKYWLKLISCLPGEYRTDKAQMALIKCGIKNVDQRVLKNLMMAGVLEVAVTAAARKNHGEVAMKIINSLKGTGIRPGALVRAADKAKAKAGSGRER
jgi:hypothetical protein